MAKILISWMALTNDFLADGKTPNPDGPTSQVHKHFYDYDYHILLSDKTKDHDLAFEVLLNFLLKTHRGHIIHGVYMNIQDKINVREIKAKVEELLLQHIRDEIEIFISPGTPSMQVAWYLAHMGLGIKTRLFQTRQGRFTKSKLPEKIHVDVEKSTIPSSIIIKENVSNGTEGDKICITSSLKPVYELAEKVAATNNTSVLILGETGTGKEKLAKFIHEKSHRANNGFIAINCAALGDHLLESRLFGYEKAAFTGADKTKEGYFQEANGGTVFLDEIGDISPYMQQTLLRVLQEKKITKLGSTKEEDIDVRIIAATNKDLMELCNKNLFRWDLFYRLSVVDLRLPSVKEMSKKEKEEIFNFLLEENKKDFSHVPVIPTHLMNTILSHSFPGNIREMINLICRLYSISDKDACENDLPKSMLDNNRRDLLKLADVTSEHVKKVYAMCGNNASKAASALDISLNTVKKNLK